ncbi:MAG: dynamin family protein [Syntrophomonadaceae bacterium]|nr:dynamin family protein [Syntrophomonadaceae bacterium]
MGLKDRFFSQAKQILDEVRSAGDEFGLHSLNRTLARVGSFAQENQYLDFAVIGQFKAGKSSFLNCYINRSILPVGSIPVTSVITRIRFGPRERITVVFNNGSSREIPVGELHLYVSESENPGNVKEVLVVDIEVPTLDNLRALRLVDTPGIGSVWRHNTETTAGWFPETGGVLFLISAERPISESELNLLQEVHAYSPEIAVVITKVDLFEEEKIREIERFTAEVLRKALGRDLPIIRYSAFKNTGEYNREVEQQVLLPAARNRDGVFARVLHHKVSSLVDSCLAYLDIS